MLRQMFDSGALTGVTVAPAPMSDGWILIFTDVSGKERRVTKARTDIEKTYKRITGALLEARSIGFKRMAVEYP